MNHLKHFLRSTAAKGSAISMSTLLIIVVVAGVGWYAWDQGYLDDLDLPFSTTGGSGDLVDVNKKLQFTWSDEWAGTVANAKTFYVYDDSMALKETLTTAATGIVASAQNYPSGTVLNVYFEDGNDKIWYTFTVPKMNVHDSEANTYNDVAFKDFEIGTYTTDSLMMNGLSVADGEQINATGNATTTPSFTYTLSNTGADNTGILESYSPLYGQAMEVWVTGTITGDNYSLVIVNGVDYQWTSGTTLYFADKISASQLSTYVIGTTTQPGYTGTASVTFDLDLTGFTATSAATMQLTVMAYADPVFAMNHAGNYGTEKVTIAEQTVTMVDI